jgi:Pyocin activator protein PrtN
MAAKRKTQPLSKTEAMQPSTYFTLFMEFQKAHIPIEEVAERYFKHNTITAKDQSRKGGYPFPIFKVGTQWMVDIIELAAYLDTVKEKARKEYELSH